MQLPDRDQSRVTIEKSSEIARKALQRIAEAQLSPTPEHFERFYREIQGMPIGVRASCTAAPRAPVPADWPELCRRLIREWDRPQTGLSYLQKLMARDRALEGQSLDTVAHNLTGLLTQWERMPTQCAESGPPSGISSAAPGDCQPWRQLWIKSVRQTLAPSMLNDPRITDTLKHLDDLLAEPDIDPGMLLPHARRLWDYADQMETDERSLREGLQQLLRLLLDNVSDLVEEDQWLSGQIHVIQELARDPQDMSAMNRAIAGVKEVLYQQGKLRTGVKEARQAIRDLVNLVLITIDSLAGQSGNAHQQLERLADELNQADDWKHIQQIVAAVIDTSKTIKTQSTEMREALLAAKNRLRSAQTRIHDLEEEMTAVSQLVHIDPLTGSLNRRGLEAAFAREMARAQRLGQPLATAIIDLDHFKCVNDTYGHDLGDQVLRGIAQILRETLRGSDTIARFGGEEFVILMPDTLSAAAYRILQRVQERLRTHHFVTRDHPLRVSFSGGISAWQQGLSQEQSIAIADEALYRAKHEGRCRIYMAAQANSSI
jgi:diguanylate cyclase